MTIDHAMFEIIKHQHNVIFQYLAEAANRPSDQHLLLVKLLESLESDLEMEGIIPIKPKFGDAADPQTMRILNAIEPDTEKNRPIYQLSENKKSLFYSRPNTVHQVHECGWIHNHEETGEVKMITKTTVTIFGKSKIWGES